MANEKMRRLMQEALDEALSPELQQELTHILDQDESNSAEFNRLNRVHRMLESAPYERAPKRLAATIMARISQTVQAQNEAEYAATQAQTQAHAQVSPEVEISRQMIQVALSLVMVATMPLLVAASWMVLHSLADVSLLNQVMQQIVSLLMLVLRVLEVFLEKAQEFAENDPEAAMALLALIPVTMLGLVRYILGNNDGSSGT